MHASLRALLTGIIDYAGLFPPAGLPLDQAIRNYARYRQSAESWMLGRFVCPAARLAELAPFHEELFTTGAPFAFSVLGRGGKDPDDFLAGLRADLEAVRTFRKQHETRVAVEVFENRLPEQLGGAYGMKEAAQVVKMADELLESHDLTSLDQYYETAQPAGYYGMMIAISGLHLQVKETTNRPCRAGFKIRCGGLDSWALPAPEQVAIMLDACRRNQLPMKFTAGLHEPFHHFDSGSQFHQHGFLNVFVAGALAHARQLGVEQIKEIIEDDNPAHFVFKDSGCRWKKIQATVDEIALARRQLVTSFGSCSFEEPCEALRHLGWL